MHNTRDFYYCCVGLLKKQRPLTYQMQANPYISKQAI
jgi:hypothetical protein